MPAVVRTTLSFAYLLPVDRHQAAEVLIKEGEADLDAEDTMGRTALSHAAKYGSTDCMNLLANCHADVFHKDHDGKTPVQIAEGSLNPRTETVNLLRRYQQVCIVDYFNTDTLYRHIVQTHCANLSLHASLYASRKRIPDIHGM